MAINFKKFWEGLTIVPKTTSTSDSKGELEVISATGKLNYHNGSSISPVVTEAHSANLTNKTLTSPIINTGVSGTAIDTDGTLANNSDTLIASQKAVKTYVDTSSGAISSALSAHLVDPVDAHDASAISNIPSGNLAATDIQGAVNELQSDIDTRSVKITAKDEGSNITTAMSSINFVGSAVVATAIGNDVIVTISTGGSGDVTGPASSTDNHVVRFDGVSGKIIQDGSPVVISDAGAISGLTGIISSGTVQSTGTIQHSGTVIDDYSTDSSTTGAAAEIASPSTPAVRVTNASLTSVSQIASPSAGRVLTITNATGASVTINNNSGATAANRILTGTGAALTLADEASIIVKYDGTETRWMVIGGTGSGSSPSTPTSFTIANNQSSAADITGLLFGTGSYIAFELKYAMIRSTATQKVVSIETFGAAYNSVSNTWSWATTAAGNTSGVDLSVTAAGQVQYTSTDLTGGSYSGTIKYLTIYTFAP